MPQPLGLDAPHGLFDIQGPVMLFCRASAKIRRQKFSYPPVVKSPSMLALQVGHRRIDTVVPQQGVFWVAHMTAEKPKQG